VNLEKFELVLSLDVEYYYEPGKPANFDGHPDSWTPAEGPLVDILRITRDGEDISLGSDVEAILVEQILEHEGGEQ